MEMKLTAVVLEKSHSCDVHTKSHPVFCWHS